MQSVVSQTCFSREVVCHLFSQAATMLAPTLGRQSLNTSLALLIALPGRIRTQEGNLHVASRAMRMLPIGPACRPKLSTMILWM